MFSCIPSRSRRQTTRVRSQSSSTQEAMARNPNINKLTSTLENRQNSRRMKQVINERRELNNYFIFSVLTYMFTFVQNFTLIFIFLHDLRNLIKVSILAGLSFICLVYLTRKIFQLLTEKDNDLRVRSQKSGGQGILDTDGSEGSFVGDNENYQPPQTS